MCALYPSISSSNLSYNYKRDSLEDTFLLREGWFHTDSKSYLVVWLEKLAFNAQNP